MRIRNHRLESDAGEPVAWVPSPNVSSGTLQATYLIMHYTAGGSAESSIRHLVKPSAKASAHLVIGRDGAITQMVAFNRVAWHAGTSRWLGKTGMNRHAIGIELDNAGPMSGEPGNWRSWFERRYDDSDVLVAAHRFEAEEQGWHRYTEAQLDAAMEASEALFDRYGLKDVLGHDDIAPDRKRDPGPAFPMEAFRSRLVGRGQDEEEAGGDEYLTTANLNVREGPGTGYAKLEESPLAKGTRLRSSVRDGLWYYVEILSSTGDATATGWAHGDYLIPADE